MDVESFYANASEEYYLIVSELVSYKQIDYAVRCFTRTGQRLLVVGDGPEYRRLRPMGGGSVEFCGRVPDDDLCELLSRCRALVIPGEEDFGITAVEALASGKPVIALGRGGVLESVPPYGGVFYDAPSEEALTEALERFERIEEQFVAVDLQCAAARFSPSIFDEKMRRVLFAGEAAKQGWHLRHATDGALTLT